MIGETLIFFSFQFILFVSIFFLGYEIFLKTKLRLFYISIMSLCFYLFFAGVGATFLLSIAGLGTYICLKLRSSSIMLIWISFLLIILVGFKYFLELPFFANNQLLKAQFGSPDNLRLLAPLGLSFFLFEFIHLMIEKRRNPSLVENLGFLRFAAFSFFWPTIVAGPIKRIDNFDPLPELQDRYSRYFRGLSLILLGFIYKYFGDLFKSLSDPYSLGLESLSRLQAFFLIALLGLRIFFDFAGYSLLAIGFARAMGISVPQNFRAPYMSSSITDFWNRWHISLSSWIRDYIYISLGGNRVTNFRLIFNLLITMALCGAWHGSSWNFVVWGFYHGILLSLHRLVKIHFPTKLLRKSLHVTVLNLGKILLTQFFVFMGWVFFFFPLNDGFTIFRAILLGAP